VTPRTTRAYTVNLDRRVPSASEDRPQQGERRRAQAVLECSDD
jgi:hypothetical protein